MTAVEQADLSAGIGRAIRAARVAASLSHAQLAKIAGISQPHLSQMENGRAAPSIAALYRIAEGLGVGPETLLPSLSDQDISVIRAGQGQPSRISDAANSASSFLLSGGPTREIEARDYRARPGQDLGEWWEHPGEDFIFVVSGRVRVCFGSGRAEELEPGDSIWYRSPLAHRWEVIGPEEVHLLLINSRNSKAEPRHPR